MSEAVVQVEAEVELRVLWRYQDGRSNKDYIISLEKAGEDLWITNYAFGAHGATLKPGTKMTKGPSTYAAARKVYDAMSKERLAKGYKPDAATGEAFVQAPGEKRHSGIQCQLLNPISEEAAKALLRDPAWLAQPKHDGKRMLVRREGSAVDGINRKGLLVGFPRAWEDAARSSRHDFVIDGEAVGDGLRVFDILELDGRDLRTLGALERVLALRELCADGDLGGPFELVETATDTVEKERLYERLFSENREGIVFKRADAQYVAGRPNSGGSQLKRKFYETCSAVVDSVNEQRSVELRILDGGVWRGLGACTIPPNLSVPEVGQVVEVRYRKANTTGGLQEPVYLGIRTDIAPDECIAEQLVFRPV